MSSNAWNVEQVSKWKQARDQNDTRTMRRLAEGIVVGNRGLALKLAVRFSGAQTPEDKEDALQAANMGILRAIQDFDPEKGTFSTHAGNHIRDYVQRWAGKCAAVVRPRSASMPASVAKAAAKHRLLFGRDPEPKDLGVTERQWADWCNATLLVEFDSGPDSQAPRGQDRVSFAVQVDPADVEKNADELELERAWKVAMSELSERNQQIAEMFFFDGQDPASIAEVFGLTRSRVVQVCKRIEIRLKKVVDPFFKSDVDYDRGVRERVERARNQEGVP